MERINGGTDDRIDDSARACRECGRGPSIRLRKDYRFTESGLGNISVKDIEVLRCEACGAESPRIPRLEDLLRTIAAALIDKPTELAGEEVRFLRKHLGESGESFARMIGVDRAHLSRVENAAMAVSRQVDRLVRSMALLQDPQLADKLRGLGRYEAALQRLREIPSPTEALEVEVEEAGNGYRYGLSRVA